MQQTDVLILGAGAAGLLCAIEAARRGRRTLVLDHADRAGKKILISGGGRCNFTNLNTRPEHFLSENPHFSKSALSQFTPADMVALVEKHRIRFHEKTLGQLFCDTSAREIVALLEAECSDARANIQLETSIQSVAKTPSGFLVETSAGPIQTESLVVATGGLSIPQMGATGLGYDLARQFGLRIVPTRPGLVPFTLSPPDAEAWCTLSGVSAEAIASLPTPAKSRSKPPAFREKILLTHRGLSGPAILQISSFWTESQPLALDLAPGREVFASLLAPYARRDFAAALAAVRAVLPTRWAERWLEQNTPPGLRSPDLPNAAIARLEARMHAWTLTPSGTEGFPKAEVTTGGVATSDLNARTLESRSTPNLFFIGEVVDVTGWLGGYNFQWAWASGFSAGQSA